MSGSPQKLSVIFREFPRSLLTIIPECGSSGMQTFLAWRHTTHHNGTRIVKFFLNLSKDEQARRFLSRIDRNEKNWKFEDGDLRERMFWDDYQEAYEDCINATATDECPWYVVPGR